MHLCETTQRVRFPHIHTLQSQKMFWRKVLSLGGLSTMPQMIELHATIHIVVCILTLFYLKGHSFRVLSLTLMEGNSG